MAFINKIIKFIKEVNLNKTDEIFISLKFFNFIIT